MSRLMQATAPDTFYAFDNEVERYDSFQMASRCTFHVVC